MGYPIPPRYIVVREEQVSRETLTSILGQRTTYTVAGPGGATGPVQPALPQELFYIALVVSIAVAVALLVMVLSPEPVSLYERAPLVARASRYVHERREVLEYVYTGVRAVLRRIFLRVRRDIGCGNCTPREASLSYRHEKIELREFSRVYEETVYGGRDPGPRETEMIREWERCLES